MDPHLVGQRLMQTLAASGGIVKRIYNMSATSVSICGTNLPSMADALFLATNSVFLAIDDKSNTPSLCPCVCVC